MARRRAVEAKGRKGRGRGERNPGALPAPPRIEVGADGFDYEVRSVPSATATKDYRCPGCDHEIKPRTTHVVVWPAGTGDGQEPGRVEDRRHWHTPCWRQRANRGPTRRWS